MFEPLLNAFEIASEYFRGFRVTDVYKGKKPFRYTGWLKIVEEYFQKWKDSPSFFAPTPTEPYPLASSSTLEAPSDGWIDQAPLPGQPPAFEPVNPEREKGQPVEYPFKKVARSDLIEA